MRFVNFDGYGPDGRRLYYKGGGDGGAGDLRAQEQERQLRVRDSSQRINDIFNGGPAHRRGKDLITDLSKVQPGGSYYDANGNPTVVQGGSGQGIGKAFSDILNRAAATRGGLYSGYEDVPESQGFDDNYYNSIADKYVAFQTPMLEEQIAAARRKLPYQFASTDNASYQRKMAELDRDYEREKANVHDQGIDFANKQRGQVEQNRADLVGMATSGADAATLAQMAATRAGALAKPPVFTPIADLFQKYTAAAANASLMNQQSPYLNRSATTLFPNQRHDAVQVIGE